MSVDRVTYSRTLGCWRGNGTAESVYYFHTFQHGLCYEFDFEFADENGTGIDIPCAMQWVTEDNNFQLMQSVLSTVSFPIPQFKPAITEVPGQKLVPSVISFEHGSTLEQPAGPWQGDHCRYLMEDHAR